MKTNPALKDFIVTVGLPGSGKSTYTLATFPNHVVLSTDDIITTIATIVNKTYEDMFEQVIEPAQQMLEAQLKLASIAKEDIVLDQTNLTKKSRARKLNLLNNKDSYWKVALVFDTPENLLNLRLSKRAESGKVISKSVLKRMQESYEMVTEDEGFDEIITISV